MYQPYPGNETHSLLGIGVDLLTVGATKTAIARNSPDMTASQVTSTQHVLIAGFIAGGVIAAVVWVILWRRASSAYFRQAPS